MVNTDQIPMRSVFLSHSVTDLAAAETLRTGLLGHRIRAHLGKPDLAPGEALWAGLRAAIVSCDVMAFLVSATDHISSQAAFEAGVARKAGKPFVTVEVDGTRLEESALHFLASAVPEPQRVRHGADVPAELAATVDRLVPGLAPPARGLWRRFRRS